MTDMSDEDLIGYCEIHCRTQRALFHRDHVNRMLVLAGHPEGFVKEIPEWQEFISVWDEMEELCRLATERMKPKP